MRDALDKLLGTWLAGCCTCRGISEAKHRATCAVGAITPWDLEELHGALWSWCEGEVEEALELAVKRVWEPELPVLWDDAE